MKFNTLGQAALGTSTVSVDGVVPTNLVAVTAGNPQWLDVDTLIFQYEYSPGLFGLGKLDYPSGTITALDVLGQNDLAAGNNNYAAYLSGGGSVGVRTNFGVGPYASAALGDMDEQGRYVMVSAQATARGLQGFSAAGAALWSSAIQLTNANVRSRNGLFAYEDQQGWHLVNIATGAQMPLSVRDDEVTLMIPVVVGTQTCVMEFTSALGYSLRGATSAQGYIIPDTTEALFNGDAVFISGKTVRVGGSAFTGEAPTDLRAFDVNIVNGTFRTGVTSSGSLVWTNQPALERATFTVSATSGSAGGVIAVLAGIYQQPVVVRDTLKMTVPWYRGLLNILTQLAAPIDLGSARVTGILQRDQGGTGNTTGTVNLPQTFITEQDESATLINARELIAGSGITLDVSVANALTISSTGGVPYFVPPSTTFTIPVNIQGLWTMPIDVEGTLVVDGYLVEVT